MQVCFTFSLTSQNVHSNCSELGGGICKPAQLHRRSESSATVMALWLSWKCVDLWFCDPHPSLLKDNFLAFLFEWGRGTGQEYLNMPGSERGGCRGWFLAVVGVLHALVSWEKWIDKDETQFNWINPQGESTSKEFSKFLCGQIFLDQIQAPVLSY